MDYSAYQAQQSKLEKRRALAQALQEQGLAGPQGAGMVSGRYVRSGLAATLAPLLQAGIGSYVGSKADKETEALNKQQTGDVDAAFNAYRGAAPEQKQASLDALTSQVVSPQERSKMLIAAAMTPKQEIIRDLDPTKYTGDSLQKFSTSRNYADLIPAPADQSPSGASMSPLLQAYNVAKTQGYTKPLLEFTQEFAANQAQYPYAVVEINGVKTLVDRTTGVPVYGAGGAPQSSIPPPSSAVTPPVTAPPVSPPQYKPPTTAPRTQPLTTLDQQAAAEAEIKRQTSAGNALGTAQGDIAGSIQTKGAGADSTISLIDQAEGLVNKATGSPLGAGVDAMSSMFGKSNEGSEAIAQLKVLQAGLMLNMPRMEGPQSDRDVALYREAAGSLGDPMVPRGIKQAALKTIRSIQERYQQRAATAGAPGAVGVPSRQQPTAPKPLTATGPNGQKLILQNGQWTPAGG